MIKKTFSKTLSANDVGATGAHQGGILIPKTEAELLAFLPRLDISVKNPDAWLECLDEDGTIRRLRFVYYNNKLHDAKGTRNEFRVTYLTRYFKEMGAKEGDVFQITGGADKTNYAIKIVAAAPLVEESTKEQPVKIKITAGWHRNH
jgi:hypothetical protein